MHLIPSGLLWLVLAAAGPSATPVDAPPRPDAVTDAARREPGAPAVGPLRRSLERFHASLSPACLDAEPQAAAASHAPRGSSDGERGARPLSCLVAAQVSPSPPRDTRGSWRWVVLILVVGLIGWLISTL